MVTVVSLHCSDYLVCLLNHVLENECVARVGWHLAAVVCSLCSLGRPAVQLLSAVDVSTQPRCPVASGAAWNIHCKLPAPIKGVLLPCSDFLVVLN